LLLLIVWLLPHLTIPSYYDISETIPSTEFFLLHFCFVMRFSIHSHCCYASFFPHRVCVNSINRSTIMQMQEQHTKLQKTQIVITLVVIHWTQYHTLYWQDTIQ
jgi:hypothetical protein